VFDSLIDGNYTTGASGEGGGLFSGFDISITRSTISGNRTEGSFAEGGGVHASNNITIVESTVSGNSTSGNSAEGGGLYSFLGAVTVTDSTISGNSTTGDSSQGGGIYGWDGITLTNTTLVGNSTRNLDSPGGGAWSRNYITATNSTVSGNSTAGTNSAGGGLFATTKLTLTNSIVMGNVTTYAGVDGDNVNIAPVEPGPNIVGGYTMATTGDLFAATAEVIDGNGVATGVFAGVLADNGGAVQTVALKADAMNPALDTGDIGIIGTPPTDARGEARFDFPGVGADGMSFLDLGAFELQLNEAVVQTSSLIVTTLDDVVDPFDGETSLREALIL
ncbi:MAG: choice-of-anchor Q domain-containing protein, partial [Thermomicrobiales bacterium]